MKRISFTIMFVISIFLNGCDDTNNKSNSNPISPTITYDLSIFNTTALQIDVEGSMNNSPVMGTYSSYYTGDMDYEGIPLLVRQNILQVRDQVFSTNTGYYQGSHFGTRTSERTCTVPDVSLISPPPTNASIGFQSGVTTFRCTDGATLEVETKLEEAGGNDAYYISTSRLNLSSGMITTEEIYTVTENMKIVVYESKISGGANNLDVASTNIIQN